MPEAIEALLDAAFGVDRHARTAYRIRAGMHWLSHLSFAAMDDAGSLLGILQCWPVALRCGEERTHPLTLVGPVAVAPAQQRGGIGRRMMDALMAQVDAGAPDTATLVMIGDPEYYGRFYGFSADTTGGWDVPGPVERHRLLAKYAPCVMLPERGTLGPLQLGR
ncbi:MAG: GNAT family N-acetyltransferase [Alphaproteobacteria bacterium]|nr:GNAT family N-acetyltransferase [Alphaproteobacteria bacterium]MDE2042433.1 N-acetyltransferase [Alphaproteobacteria bacterium]MDE2341105.1 N-acetyltransferase [Alphaproteobacteria bacterium]